MKTKLTRPLTLTNGKTFQFISICLLVLMSSFSLIAKTTQANTVKLENIKDFSDFKRSYRETKKDAKWLIVDIKT